MKKRVKFVSVITLIMTLLITNYMPVRARGIEIKKDKNGEEYRLLVMAPTEKEIFDMVEGGDIIGELPQIRITINEAEVEGTFTYPNYNNTRLGLWDLEWVFTPADDRYEPVTGTIKVNVRPRDVEDIEEIDEPTTPSLTAIRVTLDTLTSYDINLINKVSGSKYKWTSSNPSVAKVNVKNGLVTAVSEGEAIITCEITLPDGTVETLKSLVIVGYDDNAPVLTETQLDLEVGDKFDINLENKIAKSKYRWVSSDRSVVIVNSSNGKVTAMGAGEAYVTCTITTPDRQVIVLRCDISVTEPTD